MKKEALDDVDEGVKIGRELLKDVKFAEGSRNGGKFRERTSSTHEPLGRNIMSYKGV